MIRTIRTQEAKDGGGRADVLVNGELASHRRAAVAEPSFIARPGVDVRMERLVRPGMIPRPDASVLVLTPGAIGNQARMKTPAAVVPGVHVEDLGGIREVRDQSPRSD